MYGQIENYPTATSNHNTACALGDLTGMHDPLMWTFRQVLKTKVAMILSKRTSENQLTWIDSRWLVVIRGCGPIIRRWGNLIDSDFSFKSAPELPWYILWREKKNHITIPNNILKHTRTKIKIQESTCNSRMVGWKARRVFPKFLATWKHVRQMRTVINRCSINASLTTYAIIISKNRSKDMVGFCK